MGDLIKGKEGRLLTFRSLNHYIILKVRIIIQVILLMNLGFLVMINLGAFAKKGIFVMNPNIYALGFDYVLISDI